jgi:hypothetical protein
MSDKKIVIFNGPPGSGKDYAVGALGAVGTEAGLLITHNKMAEPLKLGVHKLFNLNYDPKLYDHPDHAHEKDEPLAKLFGMTPRQAYIWMSEEVLKPKFGDDVFGQMMVNTIKGQRADVHAFSDGGFVDEWLPIVDLVGSGSVLVIEVHATRDGKLLTFNGDSRSYIGQALTEARPGVTFRKIYNEHGGIVERQLYRSMVVGVVKKFLGIES